MRLSQGTLRAAVAGVTLAGMTVPMVAEWQVHCCKEVWLFVDPEEDGAPCSGFSAMSCEQPPISVLTGKWWSAFHRNAKCFSSASSEEVLVAPCWTDPGPGWRKLPGSMADGNCCFVNSTGISESSQNFQIYPCTGNGCNQNP